jgi:histidyl-tRNA synthetase
MKKRMAKADTAGARYAVIIGANEIAADAAQVKDLQTGEQQSVPFASLVEMLRR